MISIITLAFSTATFLLACGLLKHMYKQKRMIGTLTDDVYESTTQLKDIRSDCGNTLSMLHQISDRQELGITINKYTLSITRLQLIELQQRAVSNEDYESASTLQQSIEVITNILNQK